MTEVTGSMDLSASNTHQHDDLGLKISTTNFYLPFNSDELNKLENTRIKTANNCLNQAVTHHKGLKILYDILPQCSNDILTNYYKLWISKATDVLENSANRVMTVTLACKVLAKLVILYKEIPECQKQISMMHVKHWVAIITNCTTDKRIGGMFYFLAVLLNEYKEACEKQQKLIWNIVLQSIDSPMKNIVQGGANCFTLLARATERTFKPPSAKPNCTSYIYNQALICNSLHAIMDEFYAEIIEVEDFDREEKLDLPSIQEDDVTEYYFKLEKRFASLCIYLQTMLGGCGAKNSVSPNDILKLLCRGLAVTPWSLPNEDSDKKRIIFSIIPKLHVNLLSVLNALIDGFEADLLPEASIILKLYSQTLKWTENIPENHSTMSGCKAFSDVRISVYKSMSIWLTRLQGLSYIEFIADVIIPQYIFKDIVPDKNRVLLTIQRPRNLSKRALKRHEESQYQNSAVLNNTTGLTKDPLLNAELCKEALVALEHIFNNSCSMLKTSLHEATQSLVVSLLYDVYRGVDTESYYKKDEHCRLALLRVLHILQIQSHPLVPPPTQYSIDICNFATRDPVVDITHEARVFLSHLESIVHPGAATLQFSATESEEHEMEVEETNPEPSSTLQLQC